MIFGYSQEVRIAALEMYEEGLSSYKVAEIIGCSRPTVCNWLRDASVERRGLQANPDVLGRFWSKVDMSGDCWLWRAGCDKNGYGKFWVNGKTVRAIRFVYEWAYGEAPEDLFVCHTCDTPACVRPDHLWLGTSQENTLDCLQKGKYNVNSWRFLNFLGGTNARS